MRIIDVLNKIAQGDNVCTKTNEFFRKITANINYKELEEGLNSEVEIIEDVPKEDKKIKKLDYLNSDYYYKNNTYGSISAEEIVLDIKAMEDYINKIVDKINGER